jgi:hypothetical protein
VTAIYIRLHAKLGLRWRERMEGSRSTSGRSSLGGAETGLMLMGIVPSLRIDLEFSIERPTPISRGLPFKCRSPRPE